MLSAPLSSIFTLLCFVNYLVLLTIKVIILSSILLAKVGMTYTGPYDIN